jgi:hypothetical protein
MNNKVRIGTVEVVDIPDEGIRHLIKLDYKKVDRTKAVSLIGRIKTEVNHKNLTPGKYNIIEAGELSYERI